MKLILSIFLAVSLMSCEHKTITISNVIPRTDVNGNVVDAHDGRVIKFGDTFYWYGTSYGNTNGFTTNNSYVSYSSTDLVSWRPEGKLIPDAPEGVYYRPHVIYNAVTKKYVLWYNWYPVLWNGQFGVATSDKPQGPFKIENFDVKVKNSSMGVGDLNLFADDDNTAYLVYNTIIDHLISVDKLSPDYLSSTMDNSGLIVNNSEANALFKRDGRYYVLTDVCCCFCGEGSGVGVYIADNPLGPYKFKGNINRYPGSPVFSLTNGRADSYDFVPLEVTDKYSDTIVIELKTPQTISNIKLSLAWKNYRTNCSASPYDTISYRDNINPDIMIQYKKDKEWVSLESDPEITNKFVILDYLFTFPPILAEKMRIIPVKTVYSPIRISEIDLINEGRLISAKEIMVYKQSNSPGDIIVPAQQTYVMELPAVDGIKYIWMGDMWGSRPDNIKGHDIQFWSKPMEFRPDGTIKQLQWIDEYSLEL